MFLVSRGDNWPSNLLSTENMQNLSLYLLKSSVNLVVPFENENGFPERYKSTHTDGIPRVSLDGHRVGSPAEGKGLHLHYFAYNQ